MIEQELNREIITGIVITRELEEEHIHKNDKVIVELDSRDGSYSIYQHKTRILATVLSNKEVLDRCIKL